jgi:hypothetical protein
MIGRARSAFFFAVDSSSSAWRVASLIISAIAAGIGPTFVGAL